MKVRLRAHRLNDELQIVVALIIEEEAILNKLKMHNELLSVLTKLRKCRVHSIAGRREWTNVFIQVIFAKVSYVIALMIV